MNSSVSGGADGNAIGDSSAICGGNWNEASGAKACVSGSGYNTASGAFTSISGGHDNTASDDSASVSGGQTNLASGHYASVSGGRTNLASGFYASVSGGQDNTAGGSYASISGGQDNTGSGLYASINGGAGGNASGDSSAICGGNQNKASGGKASVSGGRSNEAGGNFSVAVGGPPELTRSGCDRRLRRVRLLTNCTVLTMSDSPSRADAVAIDGDRIVAVGAIEAVRAAAVHAEEVDLQSACVLPGFIDAHHHFSEGALLTSRLNLHWPAVETVSDILDHVRQEAARVPASEWIVGEGYDERRIRDRRAPTLAELDAVAPHHPVLLVQFSYHEVVVNTCAHRVLGVALDRGDPPGGEVARAADGRASGRMIENAGAPFYMGAIQALIERDRGGYFACLERYQQRLFAAGLTRIFDPAVSPLMQETMQAAAAGGVLRMPVLMMLSSANGMFMPPYDRLDGARTGDGADPLRIGPLKMFMDGGIRCAMRMGFGTALSTGVAALWRALQRRSLDPLRVARMTPVHVDFAERCIRSGILFYSEDEARTLVSAAVEHGMSIAVHAEGNVAIDRALRVLPRSRADRSPGVAPNRIEHFFLPDRDAIARAADLQLAIATQPTISEWTGEQLLDAGVIGRQLFVPLRSLLDAGLVVAGSSDAPVVSFDPLRGIRCAVERKTINGEHLGDGQEIRIGEALAMYTINAARSGGLEHEVGSIVPGKRADLVVLSHDPTQLRPKELDRLSVRRTISGGVDVFLAA